jgi:eukaryotic-like serine/threonine-protein kinase
MKPSPCPPPENLAAYQLGKLPEEELGRVAHHVFTCRPCRTHLERLDQEADALIAHLRRTPPAEHATQEVPLDRLVQAAAEAPAPSVLAPPEAPDELGRLGGYRVLEVLGVGGMGTVYRAEDPRLRRRVALKVMNPALARHPVAAQRFLREARAVATLTHDHIVAIYHVGEDRGVPFLAMPLLQGETLGDRLGREPRLSVAEVLRIGREIADGLAAAHAAGLVHRDVKPANVWLEAPGGRVKILDFGLVSDRNEDARLTQTGSLLGTPAYVSPEQARGKLVEPRSDLFSLGCVLYQLCAGTPPFVRATPFDSLRAVTREEAPPLRKAAPHVPAALAALIHQLLAKEPAGRPGSAAEVSDRLRRLAAPPGRPRRAWVLGLATVLLAVLLAPAGTELVQVLRGDRQPPPPQPPVTEQPKEPRPPAPDVDDAWVKATTALPLYRRYQTVVAKLRELNPDFQGDVHRLVDESSGKVRSVGFDTDGITNVSPLRALPELQSLRCSGSAPGRGTLMNLAPLRGLKLTHLECQGNPIVDYAPLKDMPLETVICDYDPARDADVFRSIKSLRRLNKEPASTALGIDK